MRAPLFNRIPAPPTLAVCAALLALAACEGAEEADTAPAPAPAPAETAAGEASGPVVRIAYPEDGATTGPDVTVLLETEGIEIVSITPPVVGTGHHHIYVDVDVGPLDQMIPQNDPAIIHKGDGSSEFALEGLAPGEHRLIAVVANPAHIPIDPPIMDTVHFTVANEP